MVVPVVEPMFLKLSTGTWTARSILMITHTMPLDDINKAFELMHAGESIRSVVLY